MIRFGPANSTVAATVAHLACGKVAFARIGA